MRKPYQTVTIVFEEVLKSDVLNISSMDSMNFTKDWLNADSGL